MACQLEASSTIASWETWLLELLNHPEYLLTFCHGTLHDYDS